MNRFQAQLLYGIFIAITGIFLAVLSFNPSRSIQYVVAIGIFFSAAFAFVAANKNKDSEIPFKYNWLQGIGMLLYAFAIFLYGTNFEQFITITFAFLLYFGVTEIMYGFQLLNYRRKISIAIVALRMLAGLFTTIGAVVILATSFVDKDTSLLIAGILLILGGINFMLLVNVVRRLVIVTK
jgi:uncharacterized membrane protein HdeD (DUF308 family)